MASYTLVRDVLHRVSVQLQDTSPQFQRWTSRELVEWLNDAQRAIAKYIPPACARLDAVKLKPGTMQSIERIAASDLIPGDGSTVTGEILGTAVVKVYGNLGANGTTPGRAVRLVDEEALNGSDPMWQASAGTPVTQYLFDPRMPRHFQVVPGVPTGGWWVRMAYLADPAEIPVAGSYAWDGSDTTKISVSDRFVDDLVNYVLARAWAKDAEYASNVAASAAAAQQFVASINAQAAAITGVSPNLQGLPFNSAAKVV